MFAALIYFITCHAGPTDHFVEFANVLKQSGDQVEFLATGPALKKLKERGFEAREWNPDHLDLSEISSQKILADEAADRCAKAEVVITDVGHPIMEKVHVALDKKNSEVDHFAYYDNPESYVPGGYSKVAAGVMQVASKVLFANARLADEEIYSAPGECLVLAKEKRLGIGFYPLDLAERIKWLRKTKQLTLRKSFFEKYALTDRDQKILIYFGGNNEEYYGKAFPAFLRLLKEASKEVDLSKYIILIHQHPGAKEKNIDRDLAEDWNVLNKERIATLLLSEMNLEEVQAIADVAFYYQTSLGPQFVLGGMKPCQIGHETYSDVLVRHGLAPSITTAKGLAEALEGLNGIKSKDPAELLSELGILKDWKARLKSALLISHSKIVDDQERFLVFNCPFSEG